MRKWTTLFLVTSMICSLSLQSGYCQISDPESIQLVEEEGEWLIQHKISKGETIYSLSRTYNVSVDDITSNNPGSSTGVGIDEVVLIPISDQYSHNHTVEIGETVYSISSKNGVKAEDLKKWNNIQNNDISIGQELRIFSFRKIASNTGQRVEDSYHTVASGESLYSISKQYEVTVGELIEWNDVVDYNITVGQRLKVGEKAIEVVPEEDILEAEEVEEIPMIPEEVPVTTVIVEKEDSTMLFIPEDTVAFESPLLNFDRSEERGMAELIDGNGSAESAKYLALHRSAPNGTILTVRNELNDQVVFVRVIGPLPETGANEKVVVKISRKAWENLGAVNRRLRVKVSYIL